MSLPVNQVLCGDCVEVMHGFPDESIDMIVVDPPFYMPIKQYASREKKWKPSVAELTILEPFFRELFLECDRVLKNDHSLFVFCDCQSYPLFFVQTYDLWNFVRGLIWYKGKNHFPLGRNQPFRHSYEMILHAYNSKTFFSKLNRQDVLTSNVVPSKKRLHPAEKPKAIIKELILACSKEGDLILDPMCGSGSCLVVAKSLQRKYIGIDIDLAYVEMAKKRLRKLSQKLSQFKEVNC